ncbi:hypothetical protein B0H13DRAFT_1888314 [Mycena leptocephala]|nr:hypothetical protein B0H13DRAFT_1888314 [Mycena leptocephala]
MIQGSADEMDRLHIAVVGLDSHHPKDVTSSAERAQEVKFAHVVIEILIVLSKRQAEKGNRGGSTATESTNARVHVRKNAPDETSGGDGRGGGTVWWTGRRWGEGVEAVLKVEQRTRSLEERRQEGGRRGSEGRASTRRDDKPVERRLRREACTIDRVFVLVHRAALQICDRALEIPAGIDPPAPPAIGVLSLPPSFPLTRHLAAAHDVPPTTFWAVVSIRRPRPASPAACAMDVRTTRPRPHFASRPILLPPRAPPPNLPCLSDRSQRSGTTSVSGARYDERARGDGAEQISHPVTTSVRRCERRDTARGARMTGDGTEQIAHRTRSSRVACADNECTRWRGAGTRKPTMRRGWAARTGRQGAHANPPRARPTRTSSRSRPPSPTPRARRIAVSRPTARRASGARRGICARERMRSLKFAVTVGDCGLHESAPRAHEIGVRRIGEEDGGDKRVAVGAMGVLVAVAWRAAASDEKNLRAGVNTRKVGRAPRAPSPPRLRHSTTPGACDAHPVSCVLAVAAIQPAWSVRTTRGGERIGGTSDGRYTTPPGTWKKEFERGCLEVVPLVPRAVVERGAQVARTGTLSEELGLGWVQARRCRAERGRCFGTVDANRARGS